MKRLTSVFVLCVAVLLVLNGNVFATDASGIETVMRKYQNTYHYVAVVNNYNSKYLTWPQHHCTSAPSYPSGFYGEITDDEAETLVTNIVNKFYETGSGDSNISGRFLEEPPEGEENYQTVVITEPNATDTWQSRLSQVSSDINKLTYYRAGSAAGVDYVLKSGSGSSVNCHWDPCDGGDNIDETESFQNAVTEAENDWDQSTSTYITSGITIGTSISHSCDDDCDDGDDYEGYSKNWSASISSKNFKLKSDLREHAGSATCYVKARKRDPNQPAGEPVVDVTLDNKYHSWKSASVGSVWTSDYLFDNTAPEAEEPGSTTCSGEDYDYNSYSAGWEYRGSLVVVEPGFDSETDPVKSCSVPTELTYKTKDKHIVYSAGAGCGHDTGETVKGRIQVNGYNDGMKVEVKLNSKFSDKKARLIVDTTTIDSDDLDEVYCFSLYQDDPNAPNGVYYVPFSVTALVGEDNVSFSASQVYSKSLGDDATDPNEASRVETYRSQEKSIDFQVKTNGYECCNRKETLVDNPIPQISKQVNGDVEIFLPDIEQAYIMTPSFLDMSISNYVHDVNDLSDYIKLSSSEGNSLVYSVDSNWGTSGVAASASFKWELDSNGDIIKEATHNANGTIDKIKNSADPTNFYRQFSYDVSDPTKVTSYTDYAGDISRTFTLVYDSGSGRLAGTIGGTGSSCSSCSLSGENRLYIYNDFGNVLTESDIDNTVIHEYEYDTQNRLIAKWLGTKTDVVPIQEIVYDTDADAFGGSEIQDVYDYATGSDWRLTRKVLDTNGQVITEIAFDTLNVNPSTLTDPNAAIASGGYMTTYEYEYSGTTLESISTKSPAFNNGTIDTYYNNTLNNSGNGDEETILASIDPNDNVTLSRSTYSDQKLTASYDARGIQDDKYTSYGYTSDGWLSSRDEPGIYQLNDVYIELNYDYTYYPDGRMETETVSNNNQTGTRVITTYLYNHLGHSIGTETRDYNGNLLSSTQSKSNGFGEQIYSIDKSGIARGKEYDAYGKLISEFVFADPDDTALFDGDDPNALTDDVSSVYTGLEVISQTQYVYNSLGQLEQVKVALANDAFTYDTPDSWYVTWYGYDDYGRKDEQIEDFGGLNLTTTYLYDNQGQLEKTIYPDLRWSKQIRNGRGLVKKTIEGHGLETTEPNDFVVSETVYDVNGNVIKTLKDDDVITSYELYDTGEVFRQYQGDYTTEYCDYTEYTLDFDGRVINQITVDVESNGDKDFISEIINRYNVLGQQTSQRILEDPNGVLNDLLDRVTLFSYDHQGRQIETVIKGDGNNTIYTNSNETYVNYQAGDKVQQNWYDLAGNLEYTLSFEYIGDNSTSYDLPFNNIDQAFRYTKGARDVHATCNTYSSGRLTYKDILKGFDEDDPYFNNSNYPYAGLLWHPAISYEFDDANRTVETVDADDNYTTVAYNSRNQQTQQTLWQGKPILRLSDGSYDPNTFNPYPIRKTLFGYDSAGRKSRQAQLADPNSTVTVDNVNLSYDRITDFDYDTDGKLYRKKELTEQDNITKTYTLTEYSYDGHGRVDEVEFGELNEHYLFDELFDTDKTVQKSIAYQYNTKGQKTGQITTLLNTDTGGTVDIDMTYEYDSQGRLIEIENATGIIYSCIYDALGRKTEETDAVGKVTEYGYSPLGFMTLKTEAPTGLDRQTGFGFDRFGRQVEISSGTDKTEYAYNYLNQITDVNYPSGDTIDFGYDMLGNAVSRTVTKDDNLVTTQYKRNALGRVSYKQYTSQTEWTEPNNLLPFDEILYNAAGDKEIIAYMSDGNDLELNIYSYNYFGELTGAGESGSDFSSSVGYVYDQRGLITSIIYPDEKTVTYTRDALGRIDSVTYDGKLIADYYYLGDTVVKKVMADADIEYEATVDSLGRITAEAYIDTPTEQDIIANTYGYTNHSNRLDERGTIDYTFDGLGKLTYEDTTSYTSDILGNPTNASDDGLTYAFDNEDRIVDVNDASGDVASYEYDRLGRRNSKTVGTVETHFVYDTMGNILTEYEEDGTTDTWQKDYIYGAKGEVVYMRIPQTAEMNDAFDNFVGFLEAWLCDPSCTAADLEWDYDDSNDINLIDWAYAVDANDFTGAFSTNGRYLLTDLRNSVIGMTDPNNNVIEITYNAWGTPSYSGDLEGLSILWNGYYFDDETENYYLRNRCYSPLERRFLTEDPHGINPDGNWNNPFGIRRQYLDGFGLQVYAAGEPVNGKDDWGLWQYALPASKRSKEGRTFVVANSPWEMKYDIRGLARLVRLNEEEFGMKWGKRAIHKVNGVKKCGAWVPNTAYVDRGDVSLIWKIPNYLFITETNNIKEHFLSQGYKTMVAINVSSSVIDSHLSDTNIVAWGAVAHGVIGAEGVILLNQNDGYTIHQGRSAIHHKLAKVILFTCWGRLGGWEEIVSRYGVLRASNGSFYAGCDWDDLPTE